MTLSLRNRLIRVTLFFCLAFFLFYLFSYFYLNPNGFFSLEVIRGRLDNFKTFEGSSLENFLFWSIASALAFFTFSMVSSLFLFHYFKKKISPEIFFFILFILALSLQSVRMFQLQLVLLDVSPFYGVIVTRMFYFFRLFGIACFFASSLFPIGVQFQKFGTILITILLLAFTIAALMPIDSTSMNSQFLYNISDRTSLLIMILSIRLLTIVNFIRVALTSGSKNYIAVMIAAILIVAGDELLLAFQVPALSFAMILIGTVIYSRSLYTYYLWI